MAKQINIFVENRPGRIKSITGSLAKAGVNIRAFAIQDRGDFGLIKLIVDYPKKAYLALADLGFACALKDILAVSINDKPGNLHKLTSALAEENINVIDMYGFVIEPNKQGVCCIEIENLGQTNAEEVVKKAGFVVLSDEQLYDL